MLVNAGILYSVYNCMYDLGFHKERIKRIGKKWEGKEEERMLSYSQHFTLWIQASWHTLKAFHYLSVT